MNWFKEEYPGKNGTPVLIHPAYKTDRCAYLPEGTLVMHSETYGHLFLHIRGMKKEFYQVEDVLEEIDKIYEEYKEFYNEYDEEKRWKKTKSLDKYIETIEEYKKIMRNLASSERVNKFVTFLDEALQNFDLYFSKSPLG